MTDLPWIDGPPSDGTWAYCEITDRLDRAWHRVGDKVLDVDGHSNHFRHVRRHIPLRPALPESLREDAEFVAKFTAVANKSFTNTWPMLIETISRLAQAVLAALGPKPEPEWKRETPLPPCVRVRNGIGEEVLVRLTPERWYIAGTSMWRTDAEVRAMEIDPETPLPEEFR